MRLNDLLRHVTGGFEQPMIQRANLAGRFSSADIDAMNAAVDKAIFVFDIDAAELTARERDDIVEMIETNVVNNFYKGRLLWEIQDLLPEAFKRFIESRIKP